MTPQQWQNYVPYHKGLDISFYPPVVNGKNLYFHPGYNMKKHNWVDCTITACSVNPNPLHARDRNDVDDEIARLDSKYGILQERITHKENPYLIQNFQPLKTLTRHAVVLSHPYLQGQNDYLKSRATEIHKTYLPISEVRDLEKQFEKKKALYEKSKMEYVEKMNQRTGEKFAEMDMAYIT